MSVIDNITDTCSGFGDVELSGIKLEEAKRELLDINHGSLDQHVAMQPAAIAYYLSVKKMLKRRLDNLSSAKDRWEKRQYSLAKAAVESGTTAKSAIRVEDVKARFITDNEPEIEKWEERLETVQAQYDDLDSWCEGWKQKSFSMREFVDMNNEEGFTSTSISDKSQSPISKDVRERRVRRPSGRGPSSGSKTESIEQVREFIKKRRQEKAAGRV